MSRAVAALLVAVTLCGTALGAPRRDHEASVVGLVVTYQDWDEDRPWAKRNPETRVASGVIVPGPAILTTAQMVAGATLIQVQKFGRSTRHEPRVRLVDPEVNLALLEVDDPAFARDLEPARVALRTPVDATLRTVRWTRQQLESVASRVKRFEVQESYFGSLAHVFLLAQTDLSGGGWAEPVFADGELVGLTASQTGQRTRIIPAEIVSAFLERAAVPGPYRGFPVFGVAWQVNEDRSLASYLGQQGEPTGVLVRQVPWGSSGEGVLEPLDLLLSIDGHEIDAEGYYRHPRLGQLSFPGIVADGHAIGDRVPIRVLRDGHVRDLEMPLREYPAGAALIPARRGFEPPPYFVAGGLVFRELDGDYLRSWGTEWAEKAPVHLRTRFALFREAQRPGRRRIVLLASVLPDPYNAGYESLRDVPVRSINGRPIDSIDEVRDAFRHPDGGFHTVELEPNAERQRLVLDAEQLEEATARILETYRLPPEASASAGP